MIRSAYKYNRVYLGNVKAVLFDLGGAIVDKYSLAPLHALDETFYNFKIPLDPELMKKDMGNRKDVHIKKIMRVLNRTLFLTNKTFIMDILHIQFLR